jgi:hypothetical protein
MLPTTAISWEGDDADRASMRELARRRKTTVGKLVKQAVDKSYGDELSKLKPLFVVKDGSRNDQSEPVKTRRAGR